ncbi:MAG: hypothetical protein DSY55_06085 [Clostridia bacterium]|nr:MAG: hypothetical protein DSY55_06085 [Clostridia bacterium]
MDGDGANAVGKLVATGVDSGAVGGTGVGARGVGKEIAVAATDVSAVGAALPQEDSVSIIRNNIVIRFMFIRSDSCFGSSLLYSEMCFFSSSIVGDKRCSRFIKLAKMKSLSQQGDSDPFANYFASCHNLPPALDVRLSTTFQNSDYAHH